MAYVTNINLAIPLGVAIVAKGNANLNNCSIRLLSESGCDEGAFYPAQDVHIYGRQQLIDLRDFCDRVLEEQTRLATKTS